MCRGRGREMCVHRAHVCAQIHAHAACNMDMPHRACAAMSAPHLSLHALIDCTAPAAGLHHTGWRPALPAVRLRHEPDPDRLPTRRDTQGVGDSMRSQHLHLAAAVMTPAKRMQPSQEQLSSASAARLYEVAHVAAAVACSAAHNLV